jgi:alpha-tubulin suppressor-like RCC1 family protein
VYGLDQSMFVRVPAFYTSSAVIPAFYNISVADASSGRGLSAVVTQDGSLAMTGLTPDPVTDALSLQFFDTGDAGTFWPIFMNVPDISDAKKVSTGYYSAFVVEGDGSLWALGNNYYGNLGFGDNTNRSTFEQVQGLPPVADVDAGRHDTLVLATDGTVWFAGWNDAGQFGDGTYDTGSPSNPSDSTTRSFKEITSLGSDNVAVYAGLNASYVLKSDGTLWVAGDDGYGNLGIDPTIVAANDYRVTTFAQSMTGVASVGVGMDSAVVLRTDGSVWVAGRNFFGNIGLGMPATLEERWNPTPGWVQITALGSDNAAVAMGAQHSVVLKSNGDVWVTGRNLNGQLGLNTEIDVGEFTQVPGVKAGGLVEDHSGEVTFLLEAEGVIQDPADTPPPSTTSSTTFGE